MNIPNDASKVKFQSQCSNGYHDFEIVREGMKLYAVCRRCGKIGGEKFSL